MSPRARISGGTIAKENSQTIKHQATKHQKYSTLNLKMQIFHLRDVYLETGFCFHAHVQLQKEPQITHTRVTREQS